MLKHWTGAGWRGHLLAIVVGALTTLAFAPFNLWPLAILSAGVLNLLLQPLQPKAAALRGYLFATGLFGCGVSWVYVSIHIYGYAPVPLAILLTALFCLGLALFGAIFGYLYSRWIRPLNGGRVWGFAALWVLLDWVRSWLLTGFPWLYPGYAFLETPLAGWAPVGGIWLLSFIAVATAGGMAQLASEPAKRWLSLALLMLFWLGGLALTAVEWTQPQGEARQVALIQANIPQSTKWNPDQYWPTLTLYRMMSEPYWSKVDVVIWPEAAIPGYYQKAEAFLQLLANDSERAKLITGAPWYQGEHAYNSLVAVGDGVFHKQHLVPFGEYVPLEQWLRGLIEFFDLPMSSFSPGPGRQPPLQTARMTLAPAICYEVVYPDQLRAFLPQANVLITVSNDAWFGHSIGPHQHLQMAQMRALEYGREMIRATGNGITALIDHRGNIKQRLPQFERAVLNGHVQPYQGQTPFAAVGTLPWIVFFGLVLAGLRMTGKAGSA